MRREAGYDDGALPDRVNLPIAALQGSKHQSSALQRGCIAHRGDCHVDAGSRSYEGREIGRDDYRGDVAGPQVDVANVDTHAVQHRLERLLGELGIAKRIARALQAHDKAVADELVVTHTLDGCHVLDACRGMTLKRDKSGEKEKDGAEHYWNPIRILPSG